MNTNTNTARTLVADLRPGSTIIRPGSLSEIVTVIATDSSVWSVTTLSFSDGTDMLMKNYSEVTPYCQD